MQATWTEVWIGPMFPPHPSLGSLDTPIDACASVEDRGVMALIGEQISGTMLKGNCVLYVYRGTQISESSARHECMRLIYMYIQAVQLG